VLATRNAHKVDEFCRILSALGVPVSLVGLDLFPEMPEVPETGLTFADNALLKARAVASFTGLPAVADDSGLCVDALHGMPGIFSARWSGRHGDDLGNLSLVLGQLADVSERGAQFVCAAVLVLPSPAAGAASASRAGGAASASGTGGAASASGTGGAASGRREWVATGVLSGELTRDPRGSGGFGYDPIFVAAGSQVTNAELTPQQKDAISHRGRALRALAPIIAANVAA
jgi:XTP/dITP diphosphohydrolase